MSTRKGISAGSTGAGVIAAPGMSPAHSSASGATAAAPDASVIRRAAMASFIGNFVEWFDYASYGYLATIICGGVFPEDRRGDRAARCLRRIRDLIHCAPDRRHRLGALRRQDWTTDGIVAVNPDHVGFDIRYRIPANLCTG